MSKLLRLTVVAALAFAGAAGLLIQVGQPVAGAAGLDEGRFVELINRTRADLGLPAYRLHSALQTKAAAWAGSMAATGSISHSDLALGIAVDWLRLGENVGVGGAVEALHSAFLASPTHRANMVHPGFSYLGIGVVRSGGVMFVAQEFMELQPSLPDLLSAPVAVLSSTLAPVLDLLPAPASSPVSTPLPTPVESSPPPSAPETPPPPPTAETAAQPTSTEQPAPPMEQAATDVAATPPAEPTPAESFGVRAVRSSSSPTAPPNSRAILASLVPYTLLLVVGLAFRRATADL